MTGLIIVTHGNLAQGFLDAAFMIIGPQEGAMALCTRRDDQPADMEKELRSMVAALGQDSDGVLVLTDIFGGTPTNIALPLLQPGQVEVLTGVSLPMVLKFFSLRAKAPLAELSGLLKVYGQQGVVLVSESIVD
ncbi:MAG: PTS system fructose subfamily IIA component [Desulfuromonadales bacterium]|nr:PTS system fructose subfamily IIA component [Desulfuromonadales bacterium]